MSQTPPETDTDEQRPAIERGGLWGLVLSTSGLFVSMMYVSLLPLGIVLSVWGAIRGVRARRSAKRKKASAPGALAGIIVGVASTLLSLLTITGLAIFWDEYNEYATCVQKAHTISSQDKCEQTLKDAFVERGVPAESLPF